MIFPNLNKVTWTTFLATRDLSTLHPTPPLFRNHFVAFQCVGMTDWMVLSTEGWQQLHYLSHRDAAFLRRMMEMDKKEIFPVELVERLELYIVRQRPKLTESLVEQQFLIETTDFRPSEAALH